MSRLIICPRCKGKGYKKDMPMLILATIFSGGAIPMCDAAMSAPGNGSFDVQCRPCGGSGVFIDDQDGRGL